MSAAAASRDITLFHAYELLHQHNYDVAEAIKVTLVGLQINHAKHISYLQRYDFAVKIS